jgi:outer membrane protein assembly factor BamB
MKARCGLHFGLAAVALACCAADWLSFRGNETNGSAATGRLPATWGADADGREHNIAWKAALPARGVSGPIVVGGKVIVTCAGGFRQDRLHVLAFDVASGALVWHRQFWATGHTTCHPTSSVAAPTPASDGRRICAFFSSNDLFCLDLDGNLLWLRALTYDYPDAFNDVGMASSPLIAGETVIVQVENKGDSFAAGIDMGTGQTRWRLNRLREMNWASPAILRGETPQQDLVLLQSSGGLTAHVPSTGEQVWSYDQPCSSIPSAAASEGRVFVPSQGLTALQVRPAGGPPEVLWQEAGLGSEQASPVVHRGRIYALSRAGVLTCADAANGNKLWQLRIKGPCWATPVVAGDRLLLVNDQGHAQVIQLGDQQGKLIGEADFGEPVLGTPAVTADGVFVRGDAHLWKLAEGG